MAAKDPRATPIYIPPIAYLLLLLLFLPIEEFYEEIPRVCLNSPEVRHLASTQGWYGLLAKLQELLREHMVFSLRYPFTP